MISSKDRAAPSAQLYGNVRRSNAECPRVLPPFTPATYILSTPDGMPFQGLAVCLLMNSKGISFGELQHLSMPRPLQMQRTARNKLSLFQTSGLQESDLQLRKELLPLEAGRPSWQFSLYNIIIMLHLF